MIFLNLLILALFIILIVVSKNYEKDFISTLDSNKYKLGFLFSAGLYLIDKIGGIIKVISLKKQEDSLRAIHVGESIKVVTRIYLCNKILVFGLIIFVFNILSLVSNLNTSINNNQQENNIIMRPPTSSESKRIKLDVYMSEEDILILTKEIDLEIGARRYSKEEVNELIVNAKSYIDSTILKGNVSSEEITSDINLVTYIPDTDLLVDWELENYELISRDGKVNNEGIFENINTQVIAKISYYDIEVEYQIDLVVLPRVLTKEELAYKKLIEKIEEIDENSTSEEDIELPNIIDNMEIAWEEKKDYSSIQLSLAGLILSVLTFIAYDKELYDKVEERNRQMLLDYPEIINKVTLLLGAGMPLKNAWHKIVEDYKVKSREKRYAYEEMIITSNEMMLGMSEITAYESFGRRVKLLPYLRFSSLLAQNVKKGSSDLLRILEIEAIESFGERKELAKRIGEESGTKLLFPMMLMLLIVIIIVIVPAFLSFQI